MRRVRVCLRLLIASHFLGDCVEPCADGDGEGIEKKKAALQKVWQAAEVRRHCLSAAILKISISNATSNNCFVEHFGLLSRGGRGGGGDLWFGVGVCA